MIRLLPFKRRHLYAQLLAASFVATAAAPDHFTDDIEGKSAPGKKTHVLRALQYVGRR